MVSINGIGWITENSYGCLFRKIRRSYTAGDNLSARLHDESVFVHPVKGFSRFDRPSKMACCAAGLALHDKGARYPKEDRGDMGLLGTGNAGCLQSNIDYFKDYVENGRLLGRGSLFIYTLPTSPLAEVAIHFGCRGPLMYLSCREESISSLLSHAERWILGGETSAALALWTGEDEGICFLVTPEAGEISCGSVRDLGGLDEGRRVIDLVRVLERAIVTCGRESV